jgi:DNA-binding NtrC family response regulator
MPNESSQLMIVDDKNDILHVLKPDIEKNMDCTVSTFSDPVQALRDVRDSPDTYDVLSDARMPEMTGL